MFGRDVVPDEALSSRHPICGFEPVYITDTPLTFNETPILASPHLQRLKSGRGNNRNPIYCIFYFNNNDFN